MFFIGLLEDFFFQYNNELIWLPNEFWLSHNYYSKVSEFLHFLLSKWPRNSLSDPKIFGHACKPKGERLIFFKYSFQSSLDPPFLIWLSRPKKNTLFLLRRLRSEVLHTAPFAPHLAFWMRLVYRSGAYIVDSSGCWSVPTSISVEGKKWDTANEIEGSRRDWKEENIHIEQYPDM